LRQRWYSLFEEAR